MPRFTPRLTHDCYTCATMKWHKVLGIIIVLIASQALLGCGSRGSSPSPYASLNGVWSLAGNRALGKYPLLSLSLIANGTQITALGEMEVVCGNQGQSGFTTRAEASLNLSGQIASDGTFQLAPGGNLTVPDSIKTVIHGTVPAPGQSTWSGTYSFTNAPGDTSCIVNQSAPFTALAVVPVDASYAGTLSQFKPASGKISVSVNISQGPPAVSTSITGTPIYYLPITGTVSVAGSTCSTRGSILEDQGNSITGDLLDLNVSMEDGSQVLLGGIFDGPDESGLQMATFQVRGGLCDGQIFAGTLTRQ